MQANKLRDDLSAGPIGHDREVVMVYSALQIRPL
jgi:hypothetical protein